MVGTARTGQHVTRRVGATLLAGLLALTITAVDTPPADAGIRAGERQAHGLVNQSRVENGKRRLRLNKKLVRIARKHSRKMANSESLFHNSLIGSAVESTGIDWSRVGENVGFGGSLEQVHQAFLDSPPHAQNMLRGTYRLAGVGVVKAHGLVWVTQIFVKKAR